MLDRVPVTSLFPWPTILADESRRQRTGMQNVLAAKAFRSLVPMTPARAMRLSRRELSEHAVVESGFSNSWIRLVDPGNEIFVCRLLGYFVAKRDIDYVSGVNLEVSFPGTPLHDYRLVTEKSRPR